MHDSQYTIIQLVTVRTAFRREVDGPKEAIGSHDVRGVVQSGNEALDSPLKSPAIPAAQGQRHISFDVLLLGRERRPNVLPPLDSPSSYARPARFQGQSVRDRRRTRPSFKGHGVFDFKVPVW